MQNNPASTGGNRTAPIALVALVALIGFNLRPFLTGPGPVLSDIAADTGMGFGALSLLTFLPMLLMGLGAFVTPRIQSLFGTRRSMFAALAILAAGSALRGIVPDGLSLIFTAILCGAGVAMIQALMPGLIKARFPSSIATITGLYSATIMGGGALGARLAPWFAGAAHNWRYALSLLAIPAVLALIAAVPILKEAPSTTKAAGQKSGITGTLLRRPRTWALMAAFGLVNAGYSSMVAWLAPYYQTLGLEASATGSLVATMAIAQALSALALPMLARRSTDRRPWLLFSLLMQAVGFAGLAFAPDISPVLWSAICGAGLGGSFALAMITSLDHLPKPEEAGALAAMMQGGGFLIAALGPVATALLHSITGGFASGWILHLVLVASICPLYLSFNPRHYPRVMNLPVSPANGTQ
ncbi:MULTISPECIES: cyanate transporter [Brucella]|uniref:Cyanate transport protein CynX n=1 Tax=Ochrobactrum soli TaxID=2448455 RepID=A0A2P9HQ60_9HYPH|nr:MULTISPECIES: cyanate transporter [Brucella]MCI1002894.1 cyanate transporter [Ochrobactrum sp. C6C9]MDX4074526.1 cyanate transporter [Brucella sp. NBRC 113783]RRD22252.1 MFS transporter [Brucellaceae bacterium VT-16-1752]SPL66229.1 Cyanate transport protein CynX [[Ochrobactrum] soli]